MKSYPASLLARILPFIGIGVFIIIMIMAFVLLSYIFVIGAVIGLVLFTIAYVKQKFFTAHTKKSVVVTKKQARIFDNDEFK